MVFLNIFISTKSDAVVVVIGTPDGKITEAPTEVKSMFGANKEGNLFTVHTVPTPNAYGKHVFKLGDEDTYCQYSFKSPEVVLQRGDAFMVTDIKQIFKKINEIEIIVVMAELKKINSGKISNDPNDRIVYKCEIDVTGSRIYSEETFAFGLANHFHSVARAKRHGRSYAGQAELEKHPKEKLGE